MKYNRQVELGRTITFIKYKLDENEYMNARISRTNGQDESVCQGVKENCGIDENFISLSMYNPFTKSFIIESDQANPFAHKLI